jgi:hypothetical protein
MSILDLICGQVHPKIAEMLKQAAELKYFGSTNTIVDWRYNDLGLESAKTLFILIKGGWIYTWGYCFQDGEESHKFEVYHPQEVLKLRSLLNLNDLGLLF